LKPFISFDEKLINIGVGLAMIILVSPANNVGLDISDIVLGKSLMNKRKNNGPRIEPCGNPYFSSTHREEILFRLLPFIITP
jgi:hypothetical protein